MLQDIIKHFNRLDKTEELTLLTGTLYLESIGLTSRLSNMGAMNVFCRGRAIIAHGEAKPALSSEDALADNGLPSTQNWLESKTGCDTQHSEKILNRNKFPLF